MATRIKCQQSLILDHKDVYEWTALHHACQNGHLEVVKILVELGGFNVNSTTSSQNSCLHIAAKNGRLPICKYLVEESKQRADVLLKGLDNDTPYEAARDMGKIEEGNYLKYHEKRMLHWRNRSCLLKLYIHRQNTKIFKGFSEGIM